MPRDTASTAPRSRAPRRSWRTSAIPVPDAPGAKRRAWSNWSSWPTRTRMIALVVAIDVLAALVSCSVIVLNARSAVEVEMQAAMTNVELLVSDTIDLAQAGAPSGILQTLNLRIHDLRHVRVTVLDASGAVVTSGLARIRRDQHAAPAWFAALIAPPIREHDLPIVARGQRIGTARITTQPRDEIDEVWGYAVSLSLTSLGLSLGLLIALYIAFGRVLAPLTRLADGLTQLERQDYTARLEPPASRELAIIARRFNSVAQALSETRAANGRLNRQLLSAQDDERRRTALELHDEFGPCLFALEANAASVIRIAEAEAVPDRERLKLRAQEIASIVGQVQVQNRDLLNRLRPHALGQVPLSECLDLLLRDFRRRHAGTRFAGTFEGLARGYGDVTDLTVFRCIQESMTNAVRHGRASNVTVRAQEESDPVSPSGRALRITIRDDGGGVAPDHGLGLGLSGMRERVEALGGSFGLDNGQPGAVVRIMIPLDGEQDADTSTIPGA
ncbi:ATP-binding protein [Methylobacterium sp. J-068]|uniref:ATP-binding protein n=1 Tax=Methylobacterium sp. J-068 TaxID=2836649 RepID=UPI001FBB3DA8|nr:ATP-binding protein [Methylobacterium sp. J-068]MCJ2034415.1 histidine kinase [Methylobacterium sp. J-068]